MMLVELIRDNDPAERHNFGKLFVDSEYFGETLEDKDRHLETGGEKVDGDTAIPRGRYRLTLTPSKRWNGKLMPLVCDVPGFDGVRIHGGNTEHDTLGCPLLGQIRTTNGVANCAGINERFINLLSSWIAQGGEAFLDVK